MFMGQHNRLQLCGEGIWKRKIGEKRRPKWLPMPKGESLGWKSIYQYGAYT